ncbi:MAG: GxxExxY protein [Candidatus Moraniibacteriota bacterium]
MNANVEIIFPELSYKLVGILFKVHSELGNGYQEKHYQRAIEIELAKEKLKFKRELPVEIIYEGNSIGKYFLDFLIEDKIILELKAANSFRTADFKQITAYLQKMNLKLGILANFKTEKLTYKRILNSKAYSH